AALYYRFRPIRFPLAVVPALSTHRSYSVPKMEVTPDLMQAMQAVRVDAEGELPGRMTIPEASEALDKIDGFRPTPVDSRDRERQFPMLEGQFLIDRDGVVRWMNIECSREGLEGLGKFPTHDE